jgi:diacylglycerol kinase (ATP)
MRNVKSVALVLINPNSRMGSNAEIDDGLILLRQAGFSLIEQISNSAEQTALLIERYKNEIDLVILGGGDGTISSAAEVLYRYNLAFAIIPLGTANDLARSLNIPNNVAGAFQLIASNQRSRIDLGVVNGHYFFNVAHIGLGVSVTRELTPEVKKRWGVLSYLKAVFSAFSRHKNFRVTVDVDGKIHHLYSIQLAIGNGRFYGGGNIIDENSQIDDGELCLYSLPPLSLWELLTFAPLLRLGMHRQIARAFTVSGRCIAIDTKSVKEIHADGEPVSHTPATFKVIPSALEVVRPGVDSYQ